MSFLNIEKLDTSKITDMSGMFRECKSLSKPGVSMAEIKYKEEKFLKYKNKRHF